MTPVVNTAKEFVDNIDLLSLAEGKSANSLTLPDLQYTLNTDNKTSTLTQKGSLPSINREDLRAKGIPTMGSTTGIAASTNSSSYANISFPVVNDIGGLLKKVFLTPEEDIDLAQLNLGLDLEAEVSGRAGVGFSASVGGKASLAMKTALTAGLSMNDIYESIDNPEEILNNFSNIVLKKSAIDLSQTELDVHAGLTLGAGINIYPEQWWTWGLGAELTVDVVGNMKVQPVIQGSSTQKLYLYDLLHSNSSRRLFEPTYQSRTKSQNQWSQPVQRTSADGFTGSIRSRLVDYEALIALNFKDYLGKETRAAEAENYLNINVGFDKPLYLNKKTLRVSHMPGERNSSILINETGWLTTQYSIASIIKSFSENNIRGSAGVTLVRFDDKYINNQLQQTFKKDLFKELKDQESMKSKVERNIETITNRIIAVAIPEDIGVRLAPRQSNTIDTNVVQDSMNIKVLVNGIKSEDIDETNTTGSKIHQGISFKKNILSDKTPSITLGSQDHENDKTKSLFTSFDITSQNEDVLKKLDLEIIDGDGKTILNAGNLGTIFDQISKAEAKQTDSRSVKGSNFETQFSKQIIN